MRLLHFFKEPAIQLTATNELQDGLAHGSKFSIEFWERKHSLGMICHPNGAEDGQALSDFFKRLFLFTQNGEKRM